MSGRTDESKGISTCGGARRAVGFLPFRARRSRSAVRAAVAAALAAGLGCASSWQDNTVLKETANLEVSSAVLRTQVRSLAKPFSGIIEGAADRVLAHATSSRERIAGLHMKVDGIPAFQGALFGQDPVAAAFDTAALVEQTRGWVAEGGGAGLPPLVRQEVLAALDTMRDRVHRLGDRIGATPESQQRFWSAAESWAAKHPITSGFTERETTDVLFAEFRAREATGLYATAGRLEETVADMARRFDLYGEYIAKQVRWQGELLLEESLASEYPRRALASVGEVPLAVGALPFDVDEQRDLVVAALRAERALILDFIRTERVDTLDWARLERQAIAGIVGQERELALAALRGEREAVLGALREERAAAMRDLHELVTRAVVTARGEVVDHLVLRVAQLLAVVLPLVFLGLWLLVRQARRPA